MRRQIIKTKPVQPYRIARFIIAVVVVIVIAAVALLLWTRTHAAHALTSHTFFAWQDSANAAANPPSPVALR